VVQHCEDLFVTFDKARSFALGAGIGDAQLNVRYEERELISEDYLALRGMAYFSCAAYHKGDISHEEYVNSLFPIAALAEAVGKYMGSSDDAKNIQTLMEEVIRQASSVSTTESEALALRGRYQELRKSPVLQAYAARVAQTVRTEDGEQGLMSDQIGQLRELLAERTKVLEQLHRDARPSAHEELWFRAFLLERDQARQLNQRRLAGIDERFRRLERRSGSDASELKFETSDRYELVAYETLLPADSEYSEDDARKLKSICKSYPFWPYRVFVVGKGTDEATVAPHMSAVVRDLKDCGFDSPLSRFEPGGYHDVAIDILVYADCSLGESCVVPEQG
jgi:hypothetical protein